MFDVCCFQMRAAKIVQIHDAAGHKAFDSGDYRKVR